MNDNVETSSLEHYRAQLKHPLIEVLPPFPADLKDLAKDLEYLPIPPDANVRRLPAEQRLQLTSALRGLHIAGARDGSLAEFIDRLIRTGLEARPLTAGHYANSKNRIAALVASVESSKVISPASIQAPCGSLISRSGEGKTRACRQILKRYPQVIEHDTRKNPLLPAKQVVTLHLECPSDRTIPSLVLEFVKNLEQAIEEKIPSRFTKGNRSTLISNVGELCETYWIGLIVLDECQHALRKGLPEVQLMNFLVEMSNKLNVPILYVGTPLALKLIGGQMRQARRMMGLEWAAFKANDPQWERFLTKIWPYQFTKTFTPLDERLRSTFYEYSQGIPAFAITLYELVQRYAIGAAEEESIIPERLTVVYQDYFKAVHPMIEALKSNDPDRIAQFEDLSHTYETSEWFKALSKLREDLRIQAVKKVSNAHKRATREMVNSAKSDAASFAHAIAANPAETNASLMQILLAAKQHGLDPTAVLKAAIAKQKGQEAA